MLLVVLAALLLRLDYSRSEGGSYEHYVSHPEEVGISNLVAAVLADWRAYDTLGEVVVLFTAILGVYVALGRRDT
ncbi:MAG: hydrogen gas-evolving membrane-bound hydrogenase subunit E [Thermoplasmatota archaeon]